ncbi:hypothetical protein LT679_02045 [Mucilaginibacter roseus]|uniref:Uncharacterized protein n=1 Tax=Mucilaginibacter roseus TaxID=1528868 RepID=A0ABS8TX14_9SPHI|nr:hypothetical protein [Mucilaginibacter roseus]MCD8739371.1 hypothetical protein [Mucilaginibacter roseus]
MKRIALFSSDAAALYKKDIFRIMGLQEGFVIHFRYGVEHFSVPLADFKKKIGTDVTIFFAHGNKLNTPIAQRTITNVPLREAQIIAIDEKTDTGLIHVYLKLKGFVNCNFTFVNTNDQPPQKWVLEIDVTNTPSTSWHDRLTAIKSEFVNQLFYKLELFDDQHKKKEEPVYSAKQFSSYYQLEDESQYLLDIAFFDTSPTASENSQKLSISTEDKDALKINAPRLFDVGARRDNRTYSLFTQAIASKEGYSYLNFESLNTDPSAATSGPLPNDIQLPFEISKNKRRSFYFALYTVLAAISVGYSKLVTDKSDIKGTFDLELLCHTLFALAIGLFAFYNLYRLFNKK